MHMLDFDCEYFTFNLEEREVKWETKELCTCCPQPLGVFLYLCVYKFNCVVVDEIKKSVPRAETVNIIHHSV